MQFLDPDAVDYICFSAFDIFGLTPIHQHDVKASLLEGIEQGLPVTTCAFHGDRSDPIVAEVADHLLMIFSEDAKLTYIFFILVDGHQMASRTDIDPSSLGIDDLEPGRRSGVFRWFPYNIKR